MIIWMLWSSGFWVTICHPWRGGVEGRGRVERRGGVEGRGGEEKREEERRREVVWYIQSLRCTGAHTLFLRRPFTSVV